MEGKGTSGFSSLLGHRKRDYMEVVILSPIVRMILFIMLSFRTWVRAAKTQQQCEQNLVGLHFQLVLGLCFWKAAYKNSNLQEGKKERVLRHLVRADISSI